MCWNWHVTCGFAISDGASPKRGCYELQADTRGNFSEGIVHATVNLFCLSTKISFFMHLIW